MSLGLPCFARFGRLMELRHLRYFVAVAEEENVTRASVWLQMEEALRMARTMAGGQHSEIHVGYAPSLTVDLLPRTLRLYHLPRCSGALA